MKIARAVLALLACTSAAAHAEVSACQQTLKPIHRPAPDYPSSQQAEPYVKGSSYMHVFVAGTVTVELVVSRDGTVSDARVIHSVYDLVGRNASVYKPGHFKGFLEMNVVPVVKTWRFSPIPKPCTGEFKFTWRLQDEQIKPSQPNARENVRSN
ncbi:MAG TPA: hypothetical protein VGD45_16890 [Steroidobacter sp.]|uniref:hypothetical protein n=1 Tax=Steroidobacter sp. TaxID=1978227 RepID=UPI002EDA901B